VNAVTSKVVGLLFGGNGEGPQPIGFANFIDRILLRLGITIIETPGGQTFDVGAWEEEERIGVTGPVRPEEVFAAAADRLSMSERGRELLALIRRRQSEIAELVNGRRAVTVAWRRSQGPAYLAAVMRTVREPAYRLPNSVEGISRGALAQRLYDVLMQHGSDALRADLQANEGWLTRLWLECPTFDDMARSLEQEAADCVRSPVSAC
jgi:hypothetical protein